MATIQEIQRAQDEILAQWAMDFVVKSRQRLRKVKADTTGEIIRSLDERIEPTDARLVGTAIIEFKEYGRFIDMKRLNRSEQLPTSEIVEWIKDKGLGKFKSRYRRYTGRSLPASEAKAIQAVAWGIVKGKQKRRKHRRKSWYNKHKERLILDLRDQLADMYSEYGIKSARDFLQRQTP